MTPRPDHGETSYRGSGRLPTRKALVTGGDSGIGRAATIAFAHEGADVAISHLPSEEVDAKEVITLIEAEGRKAFALPGDISNEKFARKLVKDARKKRSISYSTLRLNCGNEQLSRILPIAPINKVMAQKANPASTWQVSAPGLMRPLATTMSHL
jgi:NAD(P)-dependent dehydrogenase (short-subunit alcohol dehydrogenase family)